MQSSTRFEEWRIGYLAGMIDAEFHVGLNKRFEHPRKTPSYVSALGLRMTNLAVVKFIQEMFPDCNITYPKLVPNCLQSYQLNFTSRARFEAIRLTLPYIQGRRRQMEICLELEDLRKKYKPSLSHKGAHYIPFPPEFREKAELLFQEFRSLQLIKRPFAGKARKTSLNPTARTDNQEVEVYERRSEV